MSTLRLKWGTLKGWDFEGHRNCDGAIKILTEYHELGVSISVMMQKDNERQKELLLQLIDLCDDGEIYLDWDGELVTRERAKQYINNYAVSA